MMRVWRDREGSVRFVWQLVLLVVVLGAVANPLVLALDATNVPVVESSLKNVCILAGVLAGLWLVARLDGVSVASYGLRFTSGWWLRLLVGAVIGGGLVLCIVGVGVLLGGYELRFDPHTRFEVDPLVAMLGQGVRYLAGSTFEEAVARGFLFGAIHRIFRRRSVVTRNVLALTITSLAFSLLHLGNPSMTVMALVNLALLGVVFGCLYLRSGDLMVPIGAHCAWNVMQNVVFDLPNGGQESNASLISVTYQSGSWLTGGAIGPEGGAIACAVLVISLIWGGRACLARRVDLASASREKEMPE